jgi:hypothetical protein
MAFWRRLLAGSDWAHLLSLASPSFFDVISARDLSGRAAELARNWFDRQKYLDSVSMLEASLAGNDIGIDVVAAKPSRSVIPFRSEPMTFADCSVAGDGDAVLRLFFRQIAATETVFLDLRAGRFCRESEDHRVSFRPLPLYAHWQADFVQGVRQLYRGFYEDDSAMFAQATRALGVSVANDVFERAFGGEKKHACRCSLAEFRQTFQEVFERCRDAHVSFHPDFVTLGILLATLYDHLETLAGTYDVAAAYREAQPGQSKRSS